jgi:tetratricopeptide (TPR) repeat protein
MNEKDIAYLADQAQTSLMNGQLEEARSLFGRLCDLDKNSEENWLMLAAVQGETGALDEALRCADRAIELDGGYVEAYLLRARLLQKMNKPENALNSALKAVGIDDSYDEAWLFLAGIAGQLKRYQNAEDWAEKAVSLLPDNVDALTNLGYARYELARYAEAEQSFRQILELQPDHFQAQLGLARSAAAQARYGEALELLKPLLKRAPGHSDTLDCQASCYTGLGRDDEAAAILERIIERDSRHLHAYIRLANLYEQRGFYDKALDHLKTARDIAPDPLDVMGETARVYRECGMHPEAIETCEEALRLDPGNFEVRFFRALVKSDSAHYEEALADLRTLGKEAPDDNRILVAQAALLEKLGEYEEARFIVKMFLDHEHMPDGIVDVFARLCHRYNECDKAIELLGSMLEKPDLHKADRRSLLFSLGEIHDRMNQYDEAFACMKEANDLKSCHYDHPRFMEYVERLTAPKVTDLLRRNNIPDSYRPSVEPVFIIGMPRSGTSLIEQIIASHPHVFGGGERQEIPSLARRLPFMPGVSGEYPECLESLTPELAGQILESYDRFALGLPPGTTLLTDKLPENFQHLVFIRMLFPDARIIHCVRNAMDTCLSIYFQQFTGFHDYAYNLTDLGQHYRGYRRLMRHYRDVVKLSMFEVPYEELVNDMETWTRRIIDYCGLEWNDTCLRYYESDRLTRTASYQQVRQPIYTSSIGRWKNYEKHLQPLIDALNNQSH